MIFAGNSMYKHPPKKINNSYGYRTKRSKKTAETWKFAHEKCGLLWVKCGRILLLLSCIVQLPFIHASDKTMGLLTLAIEGVQIAVLFFTIYLVETALANNFTEDGSPKVK